MNDQQLYLAIGVPVIVNTAALLLGFTLVSGALNKRMDDLKSDFNRRLDEIILRLDRIEAKLMDHEKRIIRLEERVTPPLVRG